MTDLRAPGAVLLLSGYELGHQPLGLASPLAALVPPSRASLPPLDAYARLVLPDGTRALAGHVEATRGCLHRCRHCPIPALYDGRFFAVPVETVLADARAQVGRGARHLTIGDP